MPALIGGAVLMYLYDAALLLYHEEVAFETRRRGTPVAGGLMLELGGRQLFLPNPLTPWRPLYRLGWTLQTRPAPRRRGTASPARLAVRLSVLVPWVGLLSALFAVGLPACLWPGHGAEALLGWMAATYATILATLGVAYAHRRRLGLTGGQIGALARDALLCPPFALNLLRKVSLEQGRGLDLRIVLAGSPASHATTVLARAVQARIVTSLTFAQPGGEEEQALYRAQEVYGRFSDDAR